VVSNQTAVLFHPTAFSATLHEAVEVAKMHHRALEKRVLRRTKMILGLRISQPVDASPLMVHTLDISSSGAKIGAVREDVQAGSVIVIQRGHDRTECLVMWSRRVGPNEIQIGVEFLKHDTRFWRLDLDEGSGAGIWICASAR
jgi:hypothetical protein